MSSARRLSKMPLIWRVPLAVSVLMIIVSAVITERVLDRLGTIQQTYLQGIADSYLDGVTASISPSVLREDSWEIFDALERLKPVNAAIVPVETIVTSPALTVLAATDPHKHPSLGTLTEDLAALFPNSGMRISEDDARAYLERDILYQDKTIGRIFTIFDASPLLAERRDVLTTLILTNTVLTALLAFGGFLAVRRMLQPVNTLESHLIEAADGRSRSIDAEALLSANSEARRLYTAYNSLLNADEERRKLSQRLADEEKLASLGRLSSVMAHEINNPLGGLLNAVDTIRKHGADSYIRTRALDLLERGLQGIGEVVRAALATYRPDRQARPLSVDDFYDARLLMSPELRRHGQTLNLVIANTADFSCSCPSGPVRQAITNLLLNASTASADGTDLLFEAAQHGDRITISIGDRGPGMPDEALDILTAPARKSLPASKGLGLWVVRQIADEIGASLDVQSRDGGGSVITLSLSKSTKPGMVHAA